MVRVVVCCEGFDDIDIAYARGVWLSTSGCYDWGALIDRALKINQLSEEEVDCLLMGVAIDFDLTSLDILQDNDKIVIRPKSSTDARRKRALEDIPRDEDRKRRLYDSSKAPLTKSETKEECLPPLRGSGKKRSHKSVSGTSQRHPAETSPLLVQDADGSEWATILAQSLLPTARRRRRLFKRLILPTRNKVALATLVDYLRQSTVRLDAGEIHRALLREDHRLMTIYKLGDCLYAKFNLTVPELEVLEPLRKTGVTPTPTGVKLRLGVKKELRRLTGLSSHALGYDVQVLFHHLGDALELGSMRRMWFFTHVVVAYDNSVPTPVVTAHLLEWLYIEGETDIPDIVSMAKKDAQILDFCESELFILTEKKGVKHLTLTALTLMEERMLEYSRVRYPVEARPPQHYVATAESAFALDHAPTARDRRCAFCIAARKCLPPEENAAEPPYSPERYESSAISSCTSDCSSSGTDDDGGDDDDDECIDDEHGDEEVDAAEGKAVVSRAAQQPQWGHPPSESDSGSSDESSNSSVCPPDSMAFLRQGQPLIVYERLKASSPHANRSSEFPRQGRSGNFVNITDKHIVLKHQQTNTMHCIPLNRVLKIIEAKEGGMTLYEKSDAVPPPAGDLPQSSPHKVDATISAPASALDGVEYTSFPESLADHPILKGAVIPSAFRASRNLSDLNAWVRGEIKILQQKIRRQCHWYFSDINLKNDRFLISRLRAHGGRVPLKLLMSFNRISALTDNHSFLLETLREATDAAFSLCEEDGDLYVVATRWREDESAHAEKAREEEQVAGPGAATAAPAPLMPTVLMRARASGASEAASASRAVQEPVAPKNPLLAEPASPAVVAPKNNILTSSSTAATRVQSAQSRGPKSDEVVDVEDAQSAETGAVPQEEASRSALKKGLIGARPRNAPTALNFSN